MKNNLSMVMLDLYPIGETVIRPLLSNEINEIPK